MDIFSFDKSINEPCAIALGYFDGVHLGHRRVIDSAVEYAEKNKIKSAAFTFADVKKSSKKSCSGALYSSEHRAELLKKCGADFVIMPDFSQFCGLSPSEFVALLKEKYSARALFCGEDYRFGKGAEGNVETLKELCKKQKIELFVEKKVKFLGEDISSSRIKEALLKGDVSLAEKLLGRAYSFKASVVSGEHIGSKKLYPTINQPLGLDGAKIKNGVYASRAIIGGKRYNAVTNIGVCPTVKNIDEAVAETYILDKNIELYGQSVEVELVEFLRDERKFESIERLKAQISEDIKRAKEIL